MTPLNLTTLSEIRHQIASKTPRSRRLVGIDYILRLQKQAQLRQEMDELSVFEMLLREEMPRG